MLRTVKMVEGCNKAVELGKERGVAQKLESTGTVTDGDRGSGRKRSLV